MDRMLGTRFDTLPSPLQTFPSRAVRVTQRVPGLPWGLRYNVQLTPKGVSTPWNITYFYRLEDLPPDPGPDKNSAAQTASNSPAPRLEPSTGGLGSPELVISRGHCRFGRFDLSRLPAAKRASALALQLPGWSPF
eukprot:gene4231-5291_t